MFAEPSAQPSPLQGLVDGSHQALFRRKRSFTEYTRWRANQETTNEFLVKVLDEDLTTAAQTQQIVAVNIQPVTKGGEKIIIGGAKVPPPTTSQATNDALKDYTRFVPPTSPAMTPDGDNFIAPIPPPNQPHPLLQANGIYAVRNSLRDDSPPASPQFLARTPTLMARQYAPIAPVAFSRRTTTAPLKPPILNDYDQDSQSSVTTPTRTEDLAEITVPQRSTTKLDQFRRIHSFDPTPNYDLMTRTTYSVPDRTAPPFEFSVANDIEVDIESTTERKIFDGVRRKEDETKRDAEKDSESSYNMMFYNDEDSDNTKSNRKEDQEISDNYYEKKGVHDEALEKDSADAKEMDMEYADNRNASLKELRILQEQISSDNITLKMPAKGVIGIPGIEEVTSKGFKDSLRDKRRSICSLLKVRKLNFNSPRTLAEITNQLKLWADESPIAKWVDITHGNFTTMENPIYMMIIDDPASGQIVSAKQTVMIVAGMQGRDHHAVAAAMYVLYQLVERSEAHVDLLTKYRFWIIPVFNPDGYDYSMTFPHRREWSKNLRQLWDTCKGRDYCSSCETHGIRCTIQPCYGVNLDRNFEYQWIPADELRAEHPCGGLYAGPRQLSEAETRALTLFMHEQHTPLFTFIAFKEGSVLGVMYPYSHTRKKRAYDQIYRQRATRAASAAFSISNRPYVAGQTSEFLPLYAGGIEDWVDGHLGIDNTYSIMMFRPTDSYNSKLITERVVHEAFAAMDTLLLQSMMPTLPRPVTLARQRIRSSSSFTSPTCLMTLIPIIVLLNS
ncbi:uncharacterized protein LOC111359789 isoform X2 [Spodoptera litura]|uniref:Uncharacterized protein LOC111359789 isoform X2 n=1 Tax=Spodoptera litura TaxID=69820 RepID=A0A9J7IY21_SPOLT|nr:uncharacterized protein LOC111359789 isoform X2 [Spodoptera litura]